MTGTTSTTFNPGGTVTRQQVWMILARMAGARPADMAAAKTWAVNNGISDGTNPGSSWWLCCTALRRSERLQRIQQGEPERLSRRGLSGVLRHRRHGLVRGQRHHRRHHRGHPEPDGHRQPCPVRGDFVAVLPDHRHLIPESPISTGKGPEAFASGPLFIRF